MAAPHEGTDSALEQESHGVIIRAAISTPEITHELAPSSIFMIGSVQKDPTYPLLSFRPFVLNLDPGLLESDLIKCRTPVQAARQKGWVRRGSGWGKYSGEYFLPPLKKPRPLRMRAKAV
jgi:hypothetical protein